MINQQRRDSKKHYKVFHIELKNNKIGEITECKQNQQIYVKNKTGFYRRVNVSSFPNNKPIKGQSFQDNFVIDFSNSHQNPNQKYKPRRLYDAYQKQSPIFKNFNQQQESFIDYQKSYCSFSSEFGLIDKVYLQSIFLTRQINQQGYYQYFVRRNGQYYLQCIDDTIPVEGLHKQPIWGLSFNCPWELLLLKAWIKEKRGIGGVLQAQPFEFIYAFGLPGYSAKNIRKEVDFLKKENSELQLKKKKEERLPLNNPIFNVIAKTRSEDKIQQLGLIKNCLGYKIIPIKPSKSLISGKSNDKTIYKIRSTVPSKWIGSLSIVNKNEMLENYNFQQYGLNLEKQFLATQQQVLSIFSKYYIARDYQKQYQQGNIYQDSYVVDNALKDIPLVYRIQVFQQGKMNINIDFKQSSKRNQFIKGHDRIRWPYIKYFLAKIQNKKSSINPQMQSEKGIPGQFEPNLFKYDYYDIDFMKGYHRSVNRFLNIQKGQYLMYIKIQNMIKGVPQIDYTINISSSAKYEELRVQSLNPYQLRQLVDSTIYHYAIIHGQKYIRDRVQYIFLGNSFRQIGFGFMALQIRDSQSQITKNSNINKNNKVSSISSNEIELGIRILPGKFNKLKLAGYYYQEKDGAKSKLQKSNQPITMVCKLNYPKIIVLENYEYDFGLQQQFPQPGSIQVYTMKKKR